MQVAVAVGATYQTAQVVQAAAEMLQQALEFRELLILAAAVEQEIAPAAQAAQAS